MKTHGVLAVLGAASLSAAVSARADPLDLKLGLWETTYTVRTKGTLVTDADLKEMPPEARERFQAAMKAREAEGPQTRTTRTCLTKEDLGRAFLKGDEDERKNCKKTMVTATRAKQEITEDCGGEQPQKSEARIEAQSRERVKGTMKVVKASGSVTMDFTGKWIAAACGKED